MLFKSGKKLTYLLRINFLPFFKNLITLKVNCSKVFVKRNFAEKLLKKISKFMKNKKFQRYIYNISLFAEKEFKDIELILQRQ